MSQETKRRREKILGLLQELRSFAHVVDMHQLSKNSESMGHDGVHGMAFLNYLDYCSELLSLTSKFSALFLQNFPDPVLTDAVQELEVLTTGLTRKIWQKMMFLRSVFESDLNYSSLKPDRVQQEADPEEAQQA